MSHNDAYDALLLDLATGAGSRAEALLFETHARLQPAGRARLQVAEAIGGALLEAGPAAPMRTQLLGPPPARGEAIARESGDLAAARAMIAAAIGGEAALPWRWRPVVRECALPVEGAALLKIPAGAAMPRHGHAGREATLVLRGAFEDDSGLYRPGDIAFADGEVEHAPRVVGAEPCVCLTVTSGPPAFRSWWGRLVSRLVP